MADKRFELLLTPQNQKDITTIRNALGLKSDADAIRNALNARAETLKLRA